MAQEINKSDRKRHHQVDPIMDLATTPSKGLSRKPKISNELPEKFEMLVKLLDRLDSSIRLLRMRGSMSTFTKICPKIESLTERRFTYTQLAQMKFILPEVIEIKKVLVLDEATSCMKPDLQVKLNVDAVNSERTNKNASGYSYLRKVFRSRLLDFLKAHPEVDDIPKEILPEPFNSSEKVQRINTMITANSSLLTENSVDALPEPRSGQSSSIEEKATNLSLKEKSTDFTPEKQTCSNSTPIKERNSLKKGHFSFNKIDSFKETSGELLSTPEKLMTQTPAARPPRRSYMSPMSPNDEPVGSPNKLARRVTRVRSLKFEDEEILETSCSLSSDHDIFEILPENLLQSIREKEMKTNEEKDPAISQAKRRRKIISTLPKIFDMIHFFFQSINRSVITKEELIYRLVQSNVDIIDKRETEEQLKLLQELIPEWISEKLKSSGDLLVCINKTLTPESIRARLAQAK